MAHIVESDWKHFRAVREAALDRYCARVLEECASLIAGQRGTNHERYGRLFGLIERRDRTLANTFDMPRRSRAHAQLAGMHALGLVTDIEFARFSDETRRIVKLMLELS